MNGAMLISTCVRLNAARNELTMFGPSTYVSPSVNDFATLIFGRPRTADVRILDDRGHAAFARESVWRYLPNIEWSAFSCRSTFPTPCHSSSSAGAPYVMAPHGSVVAGSFLAMFSAAGLKLSLIHISEPTRLLSISYAVFCLKK